MDHLKECFPKETVAVLYIYFDYQESHTAVQVVRILLKQLVAQLDVVPFGFVKFYEECINGNATPHLASFLGHLVSYCAQFESVYILFDGLDECEDIQQDQILSVVQELLRQPSIMVFLTSRPHLQRLRNLPVYGVIMEIMAKEDDLRTYLCCRLETVRLVSKDLKHAIIDSITRGAEGM